MEIPRTREEIDDLFKECFKRSMKEEKQDIPTLERLSRGIALMKIFSDNEEFDDVNTEDLGFILVDFWLGLSCLRTNDTASSEGLNPKKRLATLLTSHSHFERFLIRCSILGLHKLKTEKEEQVPSTREEKIARFKHKKNLQEKIKSTTTDNREQLKCQIEIACADCLDEIDGIQREIEVLNFMIEKQLDSGNKSNNSPPPAPPKPISVTKIGANFEIQKETFQNGIFKPYHRLPTVSLEEYAEMEMKKLQEEEEKQKTKQQQQQNSKQTPILSLNEVYEQGKEDNNEIMDASIEKARKWDDWKDGVPKGSGNTTRL